MHRLTASTIVLAAFLILLGFFPAHNAQAQNDTRFITMQPPAPPHRLQVHRMADGMFLEWGDTGPSVSQYRIFRFDNNDPEKKVALIAVVPRPATSPANLHYHDTTATAGKNYIYFIVVSDVYGNQSENSPFAFVKEHN